jgi:hypothetical protein
LTIRSRFGHIALHARIGGESWRDDGCVDVLARAGRRRLRPLDEQRQRSTDRQHGGDGRRVGRGQPLFASNSLRAEIVSCDLVDDATCVRQMLKTDQHVDLTKRPMRDLYFTLMNGVYDMSVTNFGMNKTGAPIALIDEILA